MKKPSFMPWFAVQRFESRVVDAVIVVGLILFVWIVGSLGRDMNVAFTEGLSLNVSLDPLNIPYYAARSVMRMFFAYGFSLSFTLIIAYWAAHSGRAKLIILPALDILQSVPVLGFLSATVTGFMALFPGSLFGVELASIFAIFTGQVWNMAFGFYHSLVTVPRDLNEASMSFGLNPWRKFKKLELPSGAISLIWNSMMSFGGGWFFVVQSEAITVLNKKIMLPGIGSYMALAIEKGDSRAAIYSVITMILIVVCVDQLLWRPVVAWSQKFRMEQVESSDTPTSWVLNLGKKSEFVRDTLGKLLRFFARGLDLFFDRAFKTTKIELQRHPSWNKIYDFFKTVLFFGALIWIGYEAYQLVYVVETNLNFASIKRIFVLGVFTMLRVFSMVVIATLVWTPIGVWIGLRPRVARIAQPVAQIAASFPVNMTFPFMVGWFVAKNISLNFGSVLLIALGTQWYILFNVIAGASSIPSDLKESAATFGLKGVRYWRTLIIPAIFPYWVTGACTAAGGAWNASIVAEFASWGDKKIVADGLGAYIAQVTESGDWPAIFCSIGIMSLFVLVLNRVLWRSLYDLAEQKFRLD